MSIKRLLLCLSIFALTMSAQSHDMDPDVKNYKLSMEKIKAYDGMMHKVMAAASADPAFGKSISNIGDKKTLNEMVAAVDANPKLVAIVKTSGLTSREFCILPMGIMAAGMADMVQKQYKKDVSTLVTPENLTFYRTNKPQIDAMANTWGGENK